MLRILLVTVRREHLRVFIEGLSSDPEVELEYASSEAEALSIVRNNCPHLVIIDSGPSDNASLDLVRRIISVNAMVNTAVVSPLSEADFHDKSEGLGVLCRLPLEPGNQDSRALLQLLRDVAALAGNNIRS